MAEPLPFSTLAPWLARRFGRAVHRIALDAGSSCPNRDGTKGRGGCAYCDVEGSGTGALREGRDLAKQLDEGLARIARRGDGAGAIAYFQSYSNTYVSRERLLEVLGVVEAHLPARGGNVVAIAIATRPDTLPDEALACLAELNARVPVWVELGLESASDAVLLSSNRLHTRREFDEAAARVKRAGLTLIAHAILGLPGDGREGARATAEAIGACGADGVKVHHLMVLERTRYAHEWRQGRLEVLDAPTYVEWLADFVERLAPDQVLHRLTGDSPDEHLLAPRWTVTKNGVRDALARTLRARGTRQGSRWPGDSTAARDRRGAPAVQERR